MAVPHSGWPSCWSLGLASGMRVVSAQPEAICCRLSRRRPQRRRAPMEVGDDEVTAAGFDDEPSTRGSAAPARARTPINDLDDDIPF
jgi:hypothetical protein